MNFTHLIYGLSHLIKVFKPSTIDTAKDVRAWVNARIWFNMVDAQFHESITHLGKVLFKLIFSIYVKQYTWLNLFCQLTNFSKGPFLISALSR